ncbi:hypothetical protein Caci_4272 [Catenulispora acidiphila DSM 44928]|uniref:Uncharacterized protein n=1 Tax=Catenulispora acidiphila (strain DSM 44928 / JCM 14897 / NBRC 102108 / NRRL B-24433 / ID139908) TaxID=479433 RepID=C7QI91_CATAD|nr:hypothetical protein [Catenulispora acidiphila]ACU73136.1 hypothetical protein Caci_4272 [Catenulispora acidiphila DSM 44928]
MTEDLTPAIALDTATSLRAAADRRPFPAWFPPTVGVGYAASLSLMGTGYLLHGTASRAVGLTGAALVVLTFTTMLAVVAGWRRSGVVPKFEACAVDPATRRRQLRTAGLFGALMAAAMVAVVIAQWGWLEIAVGLLLGAATWRRLADQAAR